MLGFIHFLNQLPPEFIWVMHLGICYGAVLLMMRLFGAAGLYTYIAIAIISANIEVLKIVQLNFFPEPIALGTILFTSAYLAVDILVEYYHAAQARKAILIGFASMLLMLVFMMLLIGFRPMQMQSQSVLQNDLVLLFSPAPVLFASSLISYLSSQFFDLWIFQRVRRLTGERWLWLRNNASTMIAALLDTIVFNVLAWRLLSANPVSWHMLLYTYMLPTYVIRIFVSALDTPFIYWAKHAVNRTPKWLLQS